MTAVSILVLSTIFAVAAHVASKIAKRRAEKTYREFMRDVDESEEGIWHEIRPLVGGWGCSLAALEFLRGIGIFLALGAALYLIANGLP